jgi:hypothetical protein
MNNYTLLIRLVPPPGLGEEVRAAINISPMQAEAFEPLSRDHDLFDDNGFGQRNISVIMQRNRQHAIKDKKLADRKWLAGHLAEQLARHLLEELEKRDPVRGYDKKDLPEYQP